MCASGAAEIGVVSATCSSASELPRGEVVMMWEGRAVVVLLSLVVVCSDDTGPEPIGPMVTDKVTIPVPLPYCLLFS